MRWWFGAIGLGLLGIYALCIVWMRAMNDRVARLERMRIEEKAQATPVVAPPAILQTTNSETARAVLPPWQRSRGRISLDLGGRTFGSYDAQFIAGVQQRWYDLVDTSHLSATGQVKIAFEMLPDGQVANLKVLEDRAGTVASDLCKRALINRPICVPWPAEMINVVGTGPRRATMTFFYQ